MDLWHLNNMEVINTLNIELCWSYYFFLYWHSFRNCFCSANYYRISEKHYQTSVNLISAFDFKSSNYIGFSEIKFT